MTRTACLVLAVLALARPARANWNGPQERVPVERLLKNVERYAKAHPKDAASRYVLGRLHSLNASGVNALPRYREPADDVLPEFTDHEPLVPYSPATASTLAELDAAIAAFDQALALDPKLSAAWLGKGWCLEQRAILKKESLAPAYQAYAKAFDRHAHAPANTGPGAPSLDEEVAESLERVAKQLPAEQRDGALDRAVAAFRREAENTTRWVSPVLLALDGVPALAPHVDAQAQVRFDLDASHQRRTWPWLEPTAALLAFDPDGCGRIRDGEQLFGNVTWWIFWPDGYRALAALDDDGDGFLTGAELRGLVVWIDRNRDGRSEPGEVIDVRAFGIERIAVEPEGLREGVPFVARGARLRDGRALPSFDWTPRSQPTWPLARAGR
jgi:tetratricopeptide (TPR) repeat protein